MTTAPTSAAKAALRARMRAVRRALPDRGDRSARIWHEVRAEPSIVVARHVLVFTSVPGEPETAPFIEWCRANGKLVSLPEDEPPPDPASIDVVIVPGLAFTVDGDRLGQGGGWYDRFLVRLRPGAITIGVGFAEQIVDALPVEPHDQPLDRIITA